MVVDSLCNQARRVADSETDCPAERDHLDEFQDSESPFTFTRSSAFNDSMDDREENDSGSVVEQAFALKYDRQPFRSTDFFNDGEYGYRVGG